jgi:cytochrome b subunit of formate dehydrogenase
VDFIAVFLGAASLAVAGLLGAGAASLHARMHRRGRGSWPLYLTIATVVAVALFVTGAVMWLDMPREGTPTDAEYQRLLIAFMLCGAAPGAGMMVGLVAAVRRTPTRR